MPEPESDYAGAKLQEIIYGLVESIVTYHYTTILMLQNFPAKQKRAIMTKWEKLGFSAPSVLYDDVKTLRATQDKIESTLEETMTHLHFHRKITVPSCEFCRTTKKI